MEDFTDLTSKRKCHLDKLAIDTLDLSVMKKAVTNSRPKEGTWIHTRTCVLIAVRERSLEFYSDKIT